MTARVLIVDDLMPNVKMLEARLLAALRDRIPERHTATTGLPGANPPVMTSANRR